MIRSATAQRVLADKAYASKANRHALRGRHRAEPAESREQDQAHPADPGHPVAIGGSAHSAALEQGENRCATPNAPKPDNPRTGLVICIPG